MKSLGAKTILYSTPVLVIGTYDRAGKPNIMTAAWGGICSSEPPCVAVSIRKARYTYNNIVENNAFTVNIPPERYVKKIDFIGIVSGRNVDKFSATKLTPVKSELVNAPYVNEFPLFLECKLLDTLQIGVHTQFIGEIIDVKADERVLEGGLPAMKKINPIIYAPKVHAYYGVGEYLGKAFSIGKMTPN